jgi:NADH-quinone oxidoreductase subunit A
MDGWLPVVIMSLLGAAFAGFGMLASQFLGPHNPTPEKLAPYECGVPPVGDARERQSVKFYLVAMIFLLFDIEVAFLYPWAALFRELSCDGTLEAGVCLGSATPFGLIEMLVFLGILIVGLAYIWRKRALDWA